MKSPRTTDPLTANAVYFHADCLDGFAAAYAAWRHFGGDATYHPICHGEPPNLAEIQGCDVYILDFAFPPDVLLAMAAAGKSICQLDHHLSARRQWPENLPRDAGQREIFEHPELPLRVCFDLDKSGARLAWEYFHPANPLPLLLAHIEDLDLWRFKHPGTQAIARALRLRSFDFDEWDRLVKEADTTESPTYRALLTVGTAIEQFFQAEIDRLASSRLVMPARLRGEPADPLQALRHGQAVIVEDNLAWHTLSGLAINASALFASELGHRLAQQAGSFGLIWQLAPDGNVKASLRSIGEFDVSTIAARYGGGGHRNAAGFRMPHRAFLREVLNLPAS